MVHGEPEARRPEIEARLLRIHDLVDLRLEAFECALERTGGGAELVAGPDALLIVRFGPQHLGEEVQPTTTGTPAVPALPAAHVAAGPTRLVFELDEGWRVDFTGDAVLAALPSLRLRVSPRATRAGEAGEREDPAPVGAEETAIEAPYHLIVSPSVDHTFRHPAAPQGPADRYQLWRTDLAVRGADAGGPAGAADGRTGEQRTVRALWNRDAEQDPPDFHQSLRAHDRQALVDQTHGGDPANASTPLLVDRLALSSLGAWFDWKQSWDDPATIADYRHQAVMGRDARVRVAYPGFLFPFGHRCYLVRVVEREIKHREQPAAYLWERWFIVLRQPSRSYPEQARDNPFGQVSVGPLVTPDIEAPPDGAQPFVPLRNGAPFPFTLSTVDRGGQRRGWLAPLVFVQAETIRIVGRGRATVLRAPELASTRYHPVRHIQGRGQTLAVAPSVTAGDTSVEVTHLVFDGEIDPAAVTSRPFLVEARAVLPAMRHLAPQAPAVDLVLAKPYLEHGLPARAPGAPPVPGTGNAGELVLALTSPPPAIDFSGGSERSGGFVAPNLAVSGFSRALGAIGANGAAPSPFDAGSFDPSSFLSGALPKLFGLFDLVELLEVAGLEDAPVFVTDALEAVGAVVGEAARLKAALAEAQTRLTAEVERAAHRGAQDLAAQAKAALDAQTGGLAAALDALVGAVSASPPDAATVSARASALGTDLGMLLDVVRRPGLPAAVRSALTKPAAALRDLASLATSVEEAAALLAGGAGTLPTARLHWRPALRAWGLPGAPDIFDPAEPRRLLVDVEIRPSAGGGPPAVDVLAEIADFDLNLIGNTDTGLMKLMFRRIGFHTGSEGKPEVDVVFGGIQFLGPLSFVDRLRELIPFDGFSDPPYVDVTPAGARAGFDLTLPNVSVGVFSLENVSLGADARVPFLGDALTVGFAFCSKDQPFRLTVMFVGGGGWLELRAAPKGLVLLELGLEACACLSVDLGVASGSVSVAVGVYLRLEADRGLLVAYFRIRGEVDVLGLISASITLELSLAYQFETGKLLGRASLVVEVEVLFFSASVEISVERRLAGSRGDPTMFELMEPDATGLNADWVRYCEAFAPVPD